MRLLEEGEDDLVSSTLLVEQRYLKKTGLITLITVLNMTAPLTTDMYLPAVPTMTKIFDTSASILNLTLVGFFFFFAIGMLFFGPLSDKYGRKNILLTGLVIYMVSSGLCAVSTNIWQLILFRIFEALGAGAMVVISTALIKDSFDGKIRNVILATVQSMAMFAPMLAPVIGAFIVNYASWRVTFWVLAGISLICIIATLFMEEVLEPKDRFQGEVWKSVERLFTVAKNKVFTSFLLIVGLQSTIFMAYIAVSSYIYIDFFKLSETAYSFYFAMNAAVLMLGPILSIKIMKHVPIMNFITIGFIISLISGVAVVVFGKIAPIALLLSFIPFSLITSTTRPLAINTLLNQQESDTGSAASLINFGYTMLGSFGMILGTLAWSNFVTGLGIMTITFSALSLVCWILFRKSNMQVK